MILLGLVNLKKGEDDKATNKTSRWSNLYYSPIGTGA